MPEQERSAMPADYEYTRGLVARLRVGQYDFKDGDGTVPRLLAQLAVEQGTLASD